MALYLGDPAEMAAKAAEKIKRQQSDARERSRAAAERAALERQRAEAWTRERTRRVAEQRAEVERLAALGISVHVVEPPLEPPADFNPLPPAAPLAVETIPVSELFNDGSEHPEARIREGEITEVTVPAFDDLSA